jgi:FtsH-binding integral membrane protein
MALNTSAIYLGQALGAGGGGAVVAANAAAGRPLYHHLSQLGLAWMLGALALSLWVTRRMRQGSSSA